MAIVEKLKQESMFVCTVRPKKWSLLSGGRCGEVAVSGSSTVQSTLGKRRGSNAQNMNARPSIYSVCDIVYEGLDFEDKAYCFSIFFAEQEK